MKIHAQDWPIDKTATAGDYPGLYGWEPGRIENNPLAGGTAWQPAPGTVASILPGGANRGHQELYVPFTGQASAPDFIRFHASPRVLFQQAATKEKLYQ
jgi:hypothetical protein